jgi:hypothetical protein
MEDELGIRDPDMLVTDAFEVHLNSRFDRVPTDTVPKASGIKIRTQLSIEPIQDVQVELCGYTFIVVIGSDQRPFVFCKICSEEERIFASQLRPKVSENHPRLLRLEITDTRAEVERERRAIEFFQLWRAVDVIHDNRLN